MAISRSALEYQRVKKIRGAERLPLRDMPLTAQPRYGMKTVRSHRRGETRMGRWLKYA